MTTKYWLNLPYDSDNKVDLFYVYPTLYMGENEFADITDPIIRAICIKHKIKYEGIFSNTNVYMPFYRQHSGQSLADFFKGLITQKDIEALSSPRPFEDIKNSFIWFLEKRNCGKPIIFAGHSQGSVMLKLLLLWIKRKCPQVMKRIIAAYLIGWSVDQEYVDSIDLNFAKCATDTGVIISYNTKAPNCEFDPFVVSGTLTINPINWKVDDTYASKDEGLGTVIDINDDRITKFNFSDAQIDKEKGGVIANVNLEAPPPFSLGKGVLHYYDYDLYWQDLKQNVEDRIGNFKQENPEYFFKNYC